MKARLPDDEQERLDALRTYEILDTPAESGFDDLARLAANLCGTPMALVTFIDADRQWFKASVGLSIEETPRDVSFCAHAILGSDVFVVPDAASDARFLDNPFVTGDAHVRFYAGAPLIASRGHALGAICVIDRVPRQLTTLQETALAALSRQVVAQLELRRSTTSVVSAADRKRAEDLLRALTEGTASVTGGAFFSSLVQHLATALHVRRVYVAECLPDDRARSRALWMGNEPQPNFEYDLRGTPCMKVIEGRNVSLRAQRGEVLSGKPVSRQVRLRELPRRAPVGLGAARHRSHGARGRQAHVRGPALDFRAADVRVARRRRARARAGRGETEAGARRSREPQEPPAGRERVPAGGDPQGAQLRGDGRPEPGAAGRAAQGRTHCGHRRHGAHLRRDRIRQGARLRARCTTAARASTGRSSR